MIGIRKVLAGLMAITLPVAGSPLVAQSGGIMTGTGAPQQSGPSAGAAADYRVGAGDLLSISVYRSPDLQQSTRIGTDGTISFPSLGKVQVADMTAGDIAAKLADGLKAKGILVNPSVNVLVSEIRSKVVLVMGAVARPGEVPLDRPNLTLAAVLARAGATFGTGGGIVTVMEGKQENAPHVQMRISDLVSGASDRDARPGEILVVQSAPMIYVSGEVGRAGSFPLEADMTVGQAIALGGGITPRGSQSRIRLSRKGAEGTVQVLKNVTFDTKVQADDLIYVRQRLF